MFTSLHAMDQNRLRYRLWIVLVTTLASFTFDLNVEAATVLSGPEVNPSNGHSYYLLTSDFWEPSEDAAVALGGHLVTVNNQVENDWVFDTFALFGGESRTLWTGYHRLAPAGQFVWVSGDPIGFENWFPGEPNNPAEHYAAFVPPAQSPGKQWFDMLASTTYNGGPIHGVVEILPVLTINPGSTLNLGSDTIDANVNNSGRINVAGPATITGYLNNAADADTLIDWAEPVGVVGLDVGGDINNAGVVNIMIDYAEPVGISALHTRGAMINTGTVNMTIDYAEPVGISALDVDGNVTNSGAFTLNLDYAEPVGAYAVAVGGNMTNSGTFDLMIDWAEPVGLVGLDVAGDVTNNGTINIARAAEQDVTIQLGAEQSFTNGASGVVNFTGPGDVNGDLMISGKHIVAGNVVNNGRLNVRTNAQIAGSLTIAVNAETVVEPFTPCCGMTFDVAGPITNSGTFTMMTDSASPPLAVELAAGETFTNNATGVLQGTGTIDGSVLNRGTVRPGNSTGVLTITGDYTQQSDGTLAIEVAGTTAGDEYDQLAVAGAIDLDGVVEVVFGEGFAPQPGNRFDVITTVASVAGAFVGASLPGLPEGMDWNILYSANLVTLAITMPGDYNGDGSVDAADYVMWRNTLGQSAVQGLGADGDASGTIDDGDYAVWRAHFGQTVGSGAVDPLSRVPASAQSLSAAVPEPATLVVLLVGMLVMSFRRRVAVS